MICYEEEYQAIKAIIADLGAQAQARVVILTDRDGQQIAISGNELEFDSLEFPHTDSFYKSLLQSQSLRQQTFPIIEQTIPSGMCLYTIIANRVILGVLLRQESDKAFVRLRIKRASERLAEIFKQIIENFERERSQAVVPFEPPDESGGSNSPLPIELTSTE